jgi:hypothetical protein
MRSNECGHADPHRPALLRNPDQVAVEREHPMWKSGEQLAYKRVAGEVYFPGKMASRGKRYLCQGRIHTGTLNTQVSKEKFHASNCCPKK